MRWWNSLVKQMHRRIRAQAQATQARKRRLFLESLEKRTMLTAANEHQPSLGAFVVDTASSNPTSQAATADPAHIVAAPQGTQDHQHPGLTPTPAQWSPWSY